MKLNLKGIFELLGVLREYLFPQKSLSAKFQNIKNFENLENFIQERSAYVTQSTLYGYLKTRMGFKHTLMFTDKIFLESVDKSKWHIYSSALSDFTLFTFSYLIANQNLKIIKAEEIYFSILDSERLNGMPNDVILEYKKEFTKRLSQINWLSYYNQNPFKLSGEALYKWSPIADELKELDKEIVLNSIEYKWNSVVEEFKNKSTKFEEN